MIFSIATNHEELTLDIKLYTFEPAEMRVIVADANQQNTVFTDRTMKISGDGFLQVMMPVSPKNALVYIYNQKNGNLEAGKDKRFEVDSIKKNHLDKKLSVVDLGNSDIRSFINFATRFCYNAGTLHTGTYVSDDGRFKITLLPIIEDGSGEHTTPARIDIDTGEIEVSQKQFNALTVPRRMAILCHEFSHVYLNKDIHDEIEADLNGLLIYLGLGYPRIEAFEVFANAFLKVPSELNQQRYKTIINFIDDFEKNKIFMR